MVIPSNMKPHHSAILLGTIIALAPAHNAHASEEASQEFKKKLKPTLLSSNDETGISPALEFKLSYLRDVSMSPSLSRHFFAQSEGVIATNSEANSKNLFAEIGYGINKEFATPGTVPEFPDNTGTGSGAGFTFDQGAATPGQTYGNLAISATGRFETDQQFDNYNLTYGPHIGYVHTNGSAWKDAWWSLIPSVQFSYHHINVLESKAFDSLGITDDSFWRFDGVADWTFDIGNWVDPRRNHWYGGFSFGAKLQYSKAFELAPAATAAGLDDAWYYQGAINYRFEDGTKIAEWISEVYLAVGNGRIAPQPEDQTSVMLGVVLSFD